MTTFTQQTLRPGLLVSLKTALRGNVNYRKVDLDVPADTIYADEALEVTAWETTRIIADRNEYERAKKARSKATSIIRSVCSWTAFGLLCPEADADKLEAAIADARYVVDQFNATARVSRLHVYVIAGKIAADDVEAVRAINSEVRELLDTMSDGVAKLDVKAIRDAASKAKQLGELLSPDAEARVRIAIDTAREAAKSIVKAGETAAIEIDTRAIRRITEARTSFLDLQDEIKTARPATEVRSIDLAPLTTE